MDNGRALEVLQALHDGVDPYTGEIFPQGSAYQHADTVRALALAITALRSKGQKDERHKTLPSKAGVPWSDGEDQKLIQEFDGGKSIQDMSQEHGRTSGAIRSRLVRLGKITV
ncbi:MAG: hypothetical protein ACYC5N_11530 [Endomicrobiales bacterium]